MTKVDSIGLYNEIQMVQKNDFILFKNELHRIQTELDKLKIRIQEDLRSMQSEVRLELSLEKGRLRDEQSSQQLKIKEAESSMDEQVSNLKTQMETIKWEMFKTLIPLFCASGALFFSISFFGGIRGYLRFVK
jgi:hypothetical protein